MSQNRKVFASMIIWVLILAIFVDVAMIVDHHLAVKAETSNNVTVIDGNTNVTITIQSPENRTYNQRNLDLNFTINSDIPPQEYFNGTLFGLFLRHGYALDASLAQLTSYVKTSYPDNSPTTFTNIDNSWKGDLSLSDLSEGMHNVTVWIRADSYWISYSGYDWSVFSTIYFYVDIPPNVTVLSPRHQTYNSSNIPLEFTVDKPFSQVYYGIDGQGNVTISGNTTINNVADGNHSLTIYAKDAYGSVGSQAVSFSVLLTPFPVVYSYAIVAIAVFVLSLAYLLYRRHRKTVNMNQ